MIYKVIKPIKINTKEYKENEIVKGNYPLLVTMGFLEEIKESKKEVEDNIEKEETEKEQEESEKENKKPRKRRTKRK
jgi:hypothetical protein